jgi:polyphosphate glucokinase
MGHEHKAEHATHDEEASVAQGGHAPTPVAAEPGTPPAGEHPATPFTLAIDIGGTGLKASVLDASGAMVADRVRIPTTYPIGPERLVDELARLAAPLPAYDRVAAGFPGMVRAGHVLTAPHFSTESGPGSHTDATLAQQWSGFPLADRLEARFGKPTKVANDADLQGAAVVRGDGLELVVTLGTGFGSALFYEGRLLPHMEFAHYPFRKGETYNEQVGDRARKEVGEERWNKRVRRALETLRELMFFDHCYVGGGNAKRLAGDLPDDVTTVDNTAGILGGIKLFERDSGHLGL